MASREPRDRARDKNEETVSELSRRLDQLRRLIVASGEPLLSWDELEHEVAVRRGEGSAPIADEPRASVRPSESPTETDISREHGKRRVHSPTAAPPIEAMRLAFRGMRRPGPGQLLVARGEGASHHGESGAGQ